MPREQQQEIPPQIAVLPQDSAAGQVIRAETKRRMIKERYTQLKADYDAMKREMAVLKARPVDPTVESLRAELLEIKHRKVFDRLASEAKVRTVALDNLWKTSGYTIDQNSDVINEDAIKALIAEQKQKQPYMFDSGGAGDAPAAETKAESNLEPGPGNSRGGLVRDAGKFRVMRRQLRDPAFMQLNQSRLNEEWKKDNVEIID